MSDNLYFIQVLGRALEQADLGTSLYSAFTEIKKKAAQKKYAEGFMNFELFMDAVCHQYDNIATSYVHQLIDQLATGTFEGTDQEIKTLLDIINLHPQWKTEYETVCCLEANTDLARGFPEIAVLSQKSPARCVSFPKGPGCRRLNDIIAGNYKLELTNTGWTIWEGELTAKELIWSEAHKGENLRVAAGKAKEEPTNEIDLLHNGDLILRTYAGIESGSIEIELTR